jgi:hypothetical protein
MGTKKAPKQHVDKHSVSAPCLAGLIILPGKAGFRRGGTI